MTEQEVRFVERCESVVTDLARSLAFAPREHVDRALADFCSSVRRNLLEQFPDIDKSKLDAFVGAMAVQVRQRKLVIEF